MIESFLPAYDIGVNTHQFLYNSHTLEDEDIWYSERTANLTDFYQSGALDLPLNENYLELIRNIESFFRLEADWAGKGSVPVNKQVVENTRTFLDHLSYNILNGKNISIRPSTYGTIVLDFDNKEKEFSIEIGATFISYYIDSGNIFSEKDDLPASDLEVIKKLGEEVESFYKKD